MVVAALAIGCGGPKAGSKAPGGQSGKAGQHADGGGYGLADLRALEAQGSYEEMIAHAGDIRPSDRGAQWEALLEKAGIGLLALAGKDEDELAALHISKRLLELYPVLSKREGFMKARAESGVAGLQRCYLSNCRLYQFGRDQRDWKKAVVEFAETDPKNTAFIAAKMMMKFLIPEVATGLYALSVEHEGDKHCKDEDLRRSVREAKVEKIWDAEVAFISRVCKLPRSAVARR